MDIVDECHVCRVLATDMSRHFDIMGAFSSRIVMVRKSLGHRPADDGSSAKSVFQSLDKDNRMLCLQVAMKVLVPWVLEHLTPWLLWSP